MSSDWIETSLGKFIDFKNGRSSPERSDDASIPVYGSNGIIGYSEESNAPDNCLIIGRVGSYCGSVYHSYSQCWVTDNAILGLPKHEGESEFWYFLLLKLDLNNYRSGSGQPLLNQATLNSISIRIPELSEDRASIGKRLMMFDNKIELNRQINQTLEQIAQAVFKSWFVDFEPVKAKIEAKQNGQDPERAAMRAISGKTDEQLDALSLVQRQQLTATAALFTDELEGSELGEIPKGWNIKEVQDLAKTIKGKSYKSSELVESNTALVTLKSFNRGGGYRLDGLKEYTGKYKPEQEVFAGDLIIAYTDVTQAADVIGKPAMVISDSHYEHLVISLDVAVVRPEVDAHKYFLYGVAKTAVFQQHTRSYTTGTTVLHLGKSAVPEYKFAKPSEDLLETYSCIVKSMFDLINERVEENNNLESLRDTVLPKLISGELEVKDVA
ncbi:restriction endonuclease subunit S [uncultured Methylophaga sp.]|uniref:restriction endonuclease subunit S n=1 Tax=uncultured Methylophaga sp. TaxID=285271 RepID=UPI00261720D3|nr:restriction endonuclease subunit S [uncultured Methylophaga sp.]